MTTYTLRIEHRDGRPPEAKAYSTAANAIDDMEGWRAGGATVARILRDGRPIDEAALRADGDAEGTFDIT